MRALIAGAGALPAHLLTADPALLVAALDGFTPDLDPSRIDLRFRLESLGSFLDGLEARGVREICLAGAVTRVALDPAKIDARTAPLIPHMLAALQAGGDDAALRGVAKILEDRGFTLIGAHQIAPDLLPPAGCLAGAPTDAVTQAALLGFKTLDGLSALDLGQGCVIAGSRIMAVETAPGTDWMLESLADGSAKGGVFVKAPKTTQDLRFDMPTIGPETIRRAAAAQLAAVVIAQGGVIVLDRAATIRAASEAGLTLWVHP